MRPGASVARVRKITVGVQTAVLLMHMLMDPVCKELFRCCLNPNTIASSISPFYMNAHPLKAFIFKSKM